MNAKTTIRANILAAIGPAQASVFDAFAGDGEAYRRVWSRAASYVGCDLKWYRDQRLCYVADNRRLMRTISLQPFNVFDIDAWGSPWEQAAILCARRLVRPGERLGVVLSDGSTTKARLGGLPHALAVFAKVRPDVAGSSRGMDEIINRAVGRLSDRLRCRIVNRWQTSGKAAAGMMRYIGLVLDGYSAAR